ncbi:GTP cyclohydrolase II [Fulvivirgaceae bacterium BMA10]|uniref:GTP cyclohydrolase-2 n=1 Tax=Splendidivirga corallicola TaxID=3051826 RepID=A0ABT8KPG2_9BACT|nr:GTP cyclohydrolase II [Fulvivirgaceae bacterium BMA10]
MKNARAITMTVNKKGNGSISLVRTKLPTKHGNFEMYAYKSEFYQFPHIALVRGAIDPENAQNVRIHSECMTGDLFGSLRCECGEQLNHALKYFGEEGGILVYMRQEGRGIGLVNKMHTYNLQDKGYNTREANVMLGFHQDARNYDEAIEILNDLGVKRIKLMTNNPEKIKSFKDSAIDVIERIPIEMPPHDENKGYLKTKKIEMGHIFDSIKL